MIVDAHLHLWDRVHGRVHGETPVTPQRDGVIRIGEQAVLGMPAYMHDCRATVEHLIAEMDAAGVDAAVVVQEYLDGEQNDYLLDVAQRFPGRFFMHALPNWFDSDGIADEVEALLNRGFKGVKMPAHHLIGKIDLDDKRFTPVYAMLENAGCVLAVDLSEGQDQVQPMRRVLDQHPTLKVALGHFGMPTRDGWPGQLELCRYENVFIETGGIIWLYREQGYPFPDAIDAIEQAVKRIGDDKIMWGSDWPRTMVDFTYRQSIEFILSSERFNQTQKAKLLGENAAKLYRLPKPDSPRRPVKLITEF